MFNDALDRIEYTHKVHQMINNIKNNLSGRCYKSVLFQIDSIKYYPQNHNIFIKSDLTEASVTIYSGVFNIIFNKNKTIIINYDVSENNQKVADELLSRLTTIIKKYFNYNITSNKIKYLKYHQQIVDAAIEAENQIFKNVPSYDMNHTHDVSKWNCL